ncbi:unnamed protein product [Scytosiphon promiscuus]
MCKFVAKDMVNPFPSITFLTGRSDMFGQSTIKKIVQRRSAGEGMEVGAPVGGLYAVVIVLFFELTCSKRTGVGNAGSKSLRTFYRGNVDGSQPRSIPGILCHINKVFVADIGCVFCRVSQTGSLLQKFLLSVSNLQTYISYDFCEVCGSSTIL